MSVVESGIDQDCNNSLCHADEGQHKKLRIVEDAQGSDAGRPESENKDLKAGSRHQNGFNRVIDPRMRNSQLLGHRHHGGADQEDFNPRELISGPVDQGRPRIGQNELACYVEHQTIGKTGHVLSGLRLSTPRTYAAVSVCRVGHQKFWLKLLPFDPSVVGPPLSLRVERATLGDGV